jgi:hypothetical protein
MHDADDGSSIVQRLVILPAEKNDGIIGSAKYNGKLLKFDITNRIHTLYRVFFAIPSFSIFAGILVLYYCSSSP